MNVLFPAVYQATMATPVYLVTTAVVDPQVSELRTIELYIELAHK